MHISRLKTKISSLAVAKAKVHLDLFPVGKDPGFTLFTSVLPRRGYSTADTPCQKIVDIPQEISCRNIMSSSSGNPESWISSFCSLLGHEYFAEISEDFIEDDFNLTGLQTQVAMYKEALEVGPQES